MKWINALVLVIFLICTTIQGAIDREDTMRALMAYMRCYLGEQTPTGCETSQPKSGFRYAMLIRYYGEQLNGVLLDRYLAACPRTAGRRVAAHR